jgi:hypothetical protein
VHAHIVPAASVSSQTCIKMFYTGAALTGMMDPDCALFRNGMLGFEEKSWRHCPIETAAAAPPAAQLEVDQSPITSKGAQTGSVGRQAKGRHLVVGSAPHHDLERMVAEKMTRWLAGNSSHI